MSTDMRLFIAIELSEDIKAELERNAALLRSACERGTFIRRENFHLTLTFLGETAPARVREIIRLMDDCPSAPVLFTIGRMGRFKRREGDILWRKIEADGGLFRLQSALVSGLRSMGFSLEDRRFTPHLTLARRAVLKDSVSLRDLSARMPDLTYTALNMTLMQSEQVSGRAAYAPLHRSPLCVLSGAHHDGKQIRENLPE